MQRSVRWCSSSISNTMPLIRSTEEGNPLLYRLSQCIIVFSEATGLHGCLQVFQSSLTDVRAHRSAKMHACHRLSHSETTQCEKSRNMRSLRHQRPSGITTLACFEFLGALSCIGLLFFTLPGSRDWIALSVSRLCWALWLSIACGHSNAGHSGSPLSMSLQRSCTNSSRLTRPEYRNLHMLGPSFGILLSAMTLGYIFLDRSVKPVFSKGVVS